MIGRPCAGRPCAGLLHHPYAIQGDGNEQRSFARQPGFRKLKKITINLGYVDLGRIDLLVTEGFFSNRTDFIRTAIRNQLAGHAEAVTEAVARHTLEIGLRDYSRADLEAVQNAGEVLHIRVVGLARISDDVTAALARAHDPVHHRSRRLLQASAEVKAALADRIH